MMDAGGCNEMSWRKRRGRGQQWTGPRVSVAEGTDLHRDNVYRYAIGDFETEDAPVKAGRSQSPRLKAVGAESDLLAAIA